jgi:thioester reductase-like protein
MATTNCNKLIYAPEILPLFKGMSSANPNIIGTQIGSFDEMALPGPLYPYQEEWSQAKAKPIVVLHSSGSTGMPKPVIMAHGTFAVLDNEQNLPIIPGRDKQDLTMWSGKDAASSMYHHIFPPFHLAGFVTSIVVPIFTQATPVLGPPTSVPSGLLISQILKQHKIRGLFVPPFLAEAVLQEPGGLELIGQLEFLCYAGGPLSEAIGNQLNQVTKLCQFYGSTEIISVPQLFPTKENWAYIEWNPNANIRMQPAEDGTYELVVLTEQKGESALDFAFQGIKEYESRDLFKKHPSQRGLWKFHGRKDDIIVLSNGEKFNPIPFESTLQGHVAGALVVGQGHFQAALLIEPKPNTEKSGLLDSIWPIVQEANKLVPGQGRITRSMIRLSSPDKPFVRASKGTVIRKMTGKLYEAEIQDIYLKSNAPRPAGIRLRSTFQLQDVRSFVREIVSSSFLGTTLGDDDDLYQSGLDSLRTIEITKALSSELNACRPVSELTWFDSRVLYNYPSINRLAEALAEGLEVGKLSTQKNTATEMTALFNKYSKDLESIATVDVGNIARPSSDELTIALVGISGYLGSVLLDKLVFDSRIAKIFCLTRRVSTEKSSSPKLHFMEVDYSKPQLGLPDSDIQQLSLECNMVFLNAWKVNFNHSLQSFEDNIRSVRTAIEIVSRSPKNARLTFVSSISAVELYKPGAKVPEALLGPEFGDTSLSIGYAQSKLVAEWVLFEAARKCHQPITVLRVGQVAGSTEPAGNKEWPFTDALPLMIATSKKVGVLPEIRKVDWVPVNQLVDVITDILYKDLSGDKSCNTYNLVNPQPVLWSQLLEPLKKLCGPDTKVIPCERWLQKVKETDLSGAEVRGVALANLADTFTAFLHESEKNERKYELEKALAASPALASVGPITKEMLGAWIKQWGL